MKTAQQWFNEIPLSSDNVTKGEELRPINKRKLEQIQLDALKEGARRAAEIAKQESDRVCYEDPYAFLAIERAIEKWTEKDLQ